MSEEKVNYKVMETFDLAEEEIEDVEKIFLDNRYVFAEDDMSKKELNMPDFERFKKENVVFYFTIMTADAEGNFKGKLSGNIYGFMESIDLYGKPIDPHKKHHFIGRRCVVTVKDIDYENEIVILSQIQARKLAANKVLSDIQEQVDAGEEPIVNAIIRSYDKKRKRLLIDVGNMGIRGFILPKDWSTRFVKDVEENSKPYIGKIIPVAVIGILPAKVEKKVVNGKTKTIKKDLLVVCSRAKALKDPWEDLDRIYKKNDVTIIKCVEITQNGFYGQIDGLEGINVLCDFPQESSRVPIYEGTKYMGYIKKIQPERKIFTANVFAIANNQEG